MSDERSAKRSVLRVFEKKNFKFTSNDYRTGFESLYLFARPHSNWIALHNTDNCPRFCRIKLGHGLIESRVQLLQFKLYTVRIYACDVARVVRVLKRSILCIISNSYVGFWPCHSIGENNVWIYIYWNTRGTRTRDDSFALKSNSRTHFEYALAFGIRLLNHFVTHLIFKHFFCTQIKCILWTQTTRVPP